MLDQPRAEGRIDPDLAEIVSHMLFGETTITERPDLVERWIDRWLTYPGAAIDREVRFWLHRPGVADRLDEIDVPALVVHGEEDAAIDIEQGEALAGGLPDATSEAIPAAGHSSSLEEPDVATAAFREFLDSVS